ncbi:uncharacterized protein LOC107398752 [Tribolium castaneum]|uniref:Odorant receptor n=1 Tax=Tribolium castaneum TaxID=7070 RepID=D6X424_TRICA|nr:odorant receptor 154 [Tribolium castaneum]
MSNNDETDYFKIPLKFYNWSGVRITSKKIPKIISVYILYPMMIVLYGLMIINIRFNIDSLAKFIEVGISVSTMTIIALRKTLLIKNGSVYEDLLETQKLYWAYNRFGQAFESTQRKRMYFCLLVTKFIIGYSCVSLSYHSIIAPIIMHEMILPQPCWNPGNTTIGRNIIFFVENIFYIEGTSNFVIFDCLYFLLATNLRIQFALLRKELNSIDFKEDSEEKCFARLVKCSQYHKLLLSVHRKINTIYSAFFLLTYVFTITSTCTLMFVVFYMEADAALLGKSIFIVIILNTLLVMTFIPAGELEIEGEKLAMDIYFMNWYETSSLKIRKFILFWLMRAQIPLQMTGGGMLVVNRPLVLQAERVSYSLASFLANL